MVDRERALSLLDVVDVHARVLDEILPPDFSEYERDVRTRLAVERALQVAIEALVDLAAHVVASQRLGMPKDEESLVMQLRKQRVLSEEDAALLADLRRFRNVLVHQYGRLDDALVYDHAQRAPLDLQRLAAAFRQLA